MEKEGTGKKILVVDDMPESIRLVKKVLEARGYKVIGVQTGADAINAAQTELPNLILMDVRLPGGIKALSQLAHIPILA